MFHDYYRCDCVMTLRIIAGPPGSGKSTYIKTNAGADDIVIDLDKIAEAFTVNSKTGHMQSAEIRSVAIAARKSAVKRAIAIFQSDPKLNVWIINSDPSRDDLETYKLLKATVLFLNPGKSVCLDRINGVRPDSSILLINKWFAKWTHS